MEIRYPDSTIVAKFRKVSLKEIDFENELAEDEFDIELSRLIVINY